MDFKKIQELARLKAKTILEEVSKDMSYTEIGMFADSLRMEIKKQRNIK